MAEFDPLSALGGGVLIGVAAALLMLANGRVMGVSGILDGLLRAPRSAETVWRLAFVAGLAAPAVVALLAGRLPVAVAAGVPLLIAGGFLVGLGSRLANGCTSGHGICGLARLSPRSAVAVITFMSAAGATVFVTRHLLAGG